MTFNKPRQADYYDDENLMTIVDYQTPRREEDLNHKNADKAIVVDSTGTKKSRIVEEQFYVTERFGPLRLATDESFTPISYIEAGELISIEVVSDNPYLQVYLELDDYKNKEPAGVTAAELMTRGRTEYSERHFYVEDRGPDGGYVMKYHPRKTDVYKERIQIGVSNSIKKSNSIYGLISDYTSRGGIPTPATLPFGAGGTFDAPSLANSNLDNIENAIARPIGIEPYAAPLRSNLAALEDMLLDVAVSHPYIGEAGRPTLTTDPGVTDAVHRVVFFPPGVTATGTSGATPIDTAAVPYPGSSQNNSEQQIMIYGSAAESETVATGDLATLSTLDRLFVRDGAKVHFPGQIMSIQRYNTGTSAFITFTGSNGDGAYLITLSPGLNYTPEKIIIDDMLLDGRNSTKCFGVVTNANTKPTVIVREIIIRRKKKKSLVG